MKVIQVTEEQYTNLESGSHMILDGKYVPGKEYKINYGFKITIIAKCTSNYGIGPGQMSSSFLKVRNN